jgi:hypothetical protein
LVKLSWIDVTPLNYAPTNAYLNSSKVMSFEISFVWNKLAKIPAFCYLLNLYASNSSSTALNPLKLMNA